MEPLSQENQDRDLLLFEPPKVSWASSEFIRNPPNFLATVSVYILASLLVFGLIYSVFAKVPVGVKVNGILMTEQAPIPIISASSTKVLDLKVRDNQFVQKGQILMTTENQIGEEDYKNLRSLVQKITNYVVKDKENQCQKPCLEGLKALTNEVMAVELKGDITQHLVQFQDVLREFATQKSNLLNIDQLMAEQFRQIKISERKIATIKEKQAEEVLALELEQLVSKIGSLQSEINDRKNSLGVSARQSRDRLEVRLSSFFATVDSFRSMQNLTAPAAGVVTNLSVSGVGQMITTGQSLLTLVPSDTDLVAKLIVANKDIAKITKDQLVKIKLDALPEREFGSVDASILELPVNVESQRGSSQEGQAALPVYKVEAKLSRQAFEKDGKTHFFRSGMTLSGLIVVKTESLLTLGIKEIFRLKDSFLEG